MSHNSSYLKRSLLVCIHRYSAHLWVDLLVTCSNLESFVLDLINSFQYTGSCFLACFPARDKSSRQTFFQPEVKALKAFMCLASLRWGSFSELALFYENTSTISFRIFFSGIWSICGKINPLWVFSIMHPIEFKIMARILKNCLHSPAWLAAIYYCFFKQCIKKHKCLELYNLAILFTAGKHGKCLFSNILGYYFLKCINTDLCT